jgi:recombination protein RecT
MKMSNSIEAVKRATGMEPSKPKTINQMLEQMKPELQKVLPRHMNVERVMRIALTEIRKNPTLGNCEPLSLIAAVMTAAQLGLEIGVNGQAYLVPFGRECTLIPGYRGLITLAVQSGLVNVIEARVVHENDDFTFCYGLEPDVQHQPTMDDPGPVVAVYAIARLAGGVLFDVMSKKEVDSIRARSRAGKSGPWVSDYEEMARKTVVRRLCKYLPMSVDKAQKFSAALELDDAANSGSQGLTIEAAKDGTWVAPDEEAPIGHADLNELFDVLGWTVKEQGEWLKSNVELSLPELKAELNRLIDERDSSEK